MPSNMSPLEMFSRKVEGLQLAVDATSLGAFMFCPRYYQYTILEGFRGQSVDLEFGTLAHKGIEAFWRSRAAGNPWQIAQLAAVKVVFEASGHWEYLEDGEKKWHPWGGRYVDSWKCSGTKSYKNSKGNKAKCPYSFKKAWFEAPGPDICGECGSEIETVSRWVGNHKHKDRYNLLRLIAWYCEDNAETDWKTCIQQDGRPALEMSFRLKLPVITDDGEVFEAVGYLDRVETYGEQETFITDLKTTKNSLTKAYFSTFSPNIQVDMYDLLGWSKFPEWNIKGVKIEAAQLLVDGVRFAPHLVHRSDEHRFEFLDDLTDWLKEMEKAARAKHWKMNRRNCWTCGFREVCALKPELRMPVLEQNFERNYWNPTKERA